jgi:hypothetical protein
VPKRHSRHDDATLDAGERTAAKRLETDHARLNKERGSGEHTAQKRTEGDIAKESLTQGDKLTKGRPPRPRR